jgi:hypothetical protein
MTDVWNAKADALKAAIAADMSKALGRETISEMRLCMRACLHW